jgi:hypothetical protein
VTPTIGAGGGIQGAHLTQLKKPYLQVQALGGIPTKNPDLAASSLGLVLFLIAMLLTVVLFRKNKGRGRFFPFFIGLAGT